MQEKHDEGDGGTSTTADTEPQGLLESPHGVESTSVGTAICTLRGVVTTTKRTAELPGGAVEWDEIQIENLCWSKRSAEVLLQGGSVRSLIGPVFLLKGGSHRPPYCTSPGMDNAVLVRITAHPANLRLQEVLGAILL
jgi:hypothetical protein